MNQLSIRHLDVAADGRVGVAMQYEGPRADRVPLVALYDGAALRPSAASAALSRELCHCTGSMAFERDARYPAVSGPRGKLVTIWDSADGSRAGRLTAADGCGVAPAADGGFLSSSGDGRLLRWPIGGPAEVLDGAAQAWDNHRVRRPGS